MKHEPTEPRRSKENQINNRSSYSPDGKLPSVIHHSEDINYNMHDINQQDESLDKMLEDLRK